jgi:hypothetical protein
MDNISISGYYRFLGCYTDMKNQYAEFGAVRKKVFLGDDSNIPQLMLNIGGRPSKNTSFSTDLFLWTPLSPMRETSASACSSPLTMLS